MKRLKILSLVLLALTVLDACMVSTASAEEGILPNMQTFFITGSGEATLENLNKEVLKCKEFKGEGALVAGSDQKAKGTLTLTGCKALGFNVNSLGAASGTVKVDVLYLVCLVTPEKSIFGILIEPAETLHIEVPALKQLILIKDAVIALNLSGNEAKEFLFDLVGLEGKQEVATECQINGTKFKHTLESSVDTKADAKASLEAHAVVSFIEVVKLME